jgi:cytochrome c peroxidase
MRSGFVSSLAALSLFAAAGCADDDASAGAYEWRLPDGFPLPNVPADNPMSEVKVELGRRLFYDVRLSLNETQSCGSCHRQDLAFTDGLRGGVGSTGEVHPRGSMSVVNSAYFATFTWGNPLIQSLEQQALGPLFGETPVELGMAGHEEELLHRLRGDDLYPALFADAFPGDADPISLANLTRAIAAFERVLISGDAAYDRYQAGDDAALSASAVRGMELFFSERLECFHCHGGFTFSDSLAHSGLVEPEAPFHNTGLYNLDGSGAYPAPNTGVHAVTGDPADMGRFKAPTLRNIALTAPYMHDGSIATLGEVLDHYAAGGRTIAEGSFAGVGSDSPFRSEFVHGFILGPSEKADVIAFLESLTDEALITNPAFSDPFAE